MEFPWNILWNIDARCVERGTFAANLFTPPTSVHTHTLAVITHTAFATLHRGVEQLRLGRAGYTKGVLEGV